MASLTCVHEATVELVDSVPEFNHWPAPMPLHPLNSRRASFRDFQITVAEIIAALAEGDNAVR